MNYVIPAGNPELAFLHITCLIFLIIIAVSKKINLKTRKVIFFSILYSVAFTLLTYYGPSGTSLTYFYAISIFALLFVSNRAGFFAVIFNGLIFTFFSFLIHFEWIEYPLRINFQLISWITISLNSLIITTISVLLLQLLLKGLQLTIMEYKEAQSELIKKEENLTELVEVLKINNQEIMQSRIRYNTLCKITNEIIWEWDIEKGHHMWISSNNEYVTKSEISDSVDLNSWQKKIHPEDLLRVNNSFLKVLQSNELSHWAEEYRFKKNNGQYAYVIDRGYLIRNKKNKPTHFYGGMLDITHLKENELFVKKALREKESLLAEIHHRVKNNLAIISGILNLQIIQEDDDVLAEKLTDSILRIQAIARIHEQLYESESFSSINFPEAVEKLVTTIIESMQFDTVISLDFKVDESIKLDMETAVPCSLILNEIITNILKHAFKNRNSGHISVQFKLKDQ
jgi:two-component sensor histidine kinase